ncbi:DUF4954 family protein [Parabacteroides sp. OttesenSCG-928-G07]|nr:DUF4954 family protein [Parabacteroides sp. OttesenSCG-928-G07]
MRTLQPEEIRILERQRCKADDWSNVLVPEVFDIDYVHHVCFSGRIELGRFTKTITFSGGVTRHSGIQNATLHNCRIGDDVLIENVINYIANYTIGNDVVIQNVNILVTDELSLFGNNISVAVLNETGGREVPIYDKMSASLAYIIALYRHRPRLIEQLQWMISRYAESISSKEGTIGDSVKIINVGTIRNVRIGDNATIENTTRLENGTINSNATAPVYIGDSVIAHDFIISSGAFISDAAKIIRCFVGQACYVTHNFSAHDSLLFSNCTFENGEACAIFAGPFTVSMHKSSLLIAGMFSFLNAGSGSNQSNHMYKLGPIHQGIVERGSKTTSDSYILWPARVGAFSLVMGRHYHHSDTSDIPFSYLIEKNDETYLVPGVNLRSVGTIRDAQKWPARDKRKDPCMLDRINYNLLSPYTIQKMMKAVDILKNLRQLAGETSEVYYYQNARIKSSSLQKGIGHYNMGITKFLGNSLIKKLEKTAFKSLEEVWEQLQPDEAYGEGEWFDLSGLILPKSMLDGLLQLIEEGSVTSLTEVEEFFIKAHKDYYSLEWTWAYKAIEQYFNLKLSSITSEQIIMIVEKWKEAVIGLDEMLYEDARKEFSLTAKIGFGVDGSNSEKQKDFVGVRGEFESNPFVMSVKDHIVTKRALGDELIKRIKAIN